MIGVHLSRVVLRENHPQQWIHLEEDGGDRGFPIVIGMGEASEIRRVLHGESTPRPLTHQLMASLVEELGGEVTGVDLVDLRDNTFYAQILLRSSSGEEVRIDARPSDALAIGLRVGCPLRVAESVLEEARVDKKGAGPDPLPEEPSEPEPDSDPEDPKTDPQGGLDTELG